MDYGVIISLALFLLVQTGTLIWFLASLNGKVANLIEKVNNINNAYVTEKDLSEKHKRIYMRIEEVEKDITHIEENCKLNRAIKK